MTDKSSPSSSRQGGKATGKAKKRAPNHFKPTGSALVQGLIAGADDVASRSFLGGGGTVPTAPRPVADDPAGPPPSAPVPTGPTTDATTIPGDESQVPAPESPAPVTPRPNPVSDTVVPADEHDAPVPPPATAARPVPASQPPPTYDDAPLSQAAPASAAPNPAARLGVPAPGATTAPRPRRPRTDTAEPAQRNNVTADTADHADTDTDTDTDTSTNAKHLSKDTGPKESAKRNGASAPAPRRDDSVPGTAAPTASASAPSHSVAPSPSARSGSGGAGRGGPGQSWAHAAVFASYADAKMHPTRWQGYGFRIAPDVLAALKNRVNADRRTTGNSGLALGHYVDAALRHVPEDIEEQIAMARAFEDDRMWDLERTQPSTYRVGEQVLAFISSLNLALQEAGFGRRGTSVVSAVIERFLQAMDEEGPLQRPQRVRKAGPGTGT